MGTAPCAYPTMLFFENLIRALLIFNGLRNRYRQRALLVYHYPRGQGVVVAPAGRPGSARPVRGWPAPGCAGVAGARTRLRGPRPPGRSAMHRMRGEAPL